MVAQKKARSKKVKTVAGILILLFLAFCILFQSLIKPQGPVLPSENLTPQPDTLKIKTLLKQLEDANTTKECHQAPLETARQTITKKSNVVLAQETPSKIEDLVKSYFPEEPEVMLAIFKHESGLNPTAQGWNCMYNGESRACKKEDRAKAWSTDCGIVQNNFPGTICPPYAFDPVWSLKEGRKKYDANQKSGIDGKLRWSSYKSGAYKKYL